MPRLRILQLDNNHFDGSTIPASYANMSKLLKLSLRNCSLHGPMLDLSRIPNLSYLDLSSNQLNETISPNKLSDNITTIKLSNNNLTGTIPVYFSGLPRLQKLLITNNSLSGSVSSTIWPNRTLNATESLILDLQNNRLTNVLGTIDLPANVTVRLQGNPLCSNANFLQFCGSQNQDEDNNQGSRNYTDDCPKCSSPFDHARESPVSCFCAAPSLVGYQLKSPGFSDFLPYHDLFEKYLTSGLDLYLYQLDIDSFQWQKGPRLKMYLKIFPVYDNVSNNPNIFNRSEVQRIWSMFTGWTIPENKFFGPYELLNFTLLDPYKDASNISIKINGVRDLTYGEMALATSNFDSSNQVGQGGYGKVYKDVLADGTVVAVKRAQENSLQGEKEFLTVIELLSRLHHRNLVSLTGYCGEEDEQCAFFCHHTE